MIPIHENLTGRVAVITGGSGVLCSKMAEELARHGVKIAILNRTAEKGQQVVDNITQLGGTAISIATDVLDRTSLVNAREEIIESFGRVDLLITTVKQPTIEMANLAAELLLNQIKNNEKVETGVYRIKPTLLSRSSC